MRGIGPYRLAGMAAPMTVWALHFVLVYSLAGLGCEEGWHLRHAAGLSLLKWSLLLSTVFALALVGWLGMRAWRSARASAAPADALQRRHRFMARATTILSVLAAIAIVFTATPAAMLPSCT